MSTNSGSVALHETGTVLPRKRRIAAVVLAAVFGIGMFVGRASAPNNGDALGQQVETITLTSADLHDPMATLHRRIYAHFPHVESTPLPLSDLRDPMAALHRRIYAHFPEE